MDPTSKAASIPSFFNQAQSMSNVELLKNANKLSDSQVALTLEIIQKIIKNEDDFIHKHEQGSDPKVEKKLGTIIKILSGEKNPSFAARMKSAIQSLFQNKENRIIQRQNLLYSIPLKTTFIQKGRTTNDLVQDMKNNSLDTTKRVTYQLYREYNGGLVGSVKIDNQPLEMPKPEKQPEHWNSLIPKQLQDYIPNYNAEDPSIAILLTQSVTSDALTLISKLVRYPQRPDAAFYAGSFPLFNFTKVDGNTILKVSFKTALSVPDLHKGGLIPIKSYEITQEINLTNPDTPVKMEFKPIDN